MVLIQEKIYIKNPEWSPCLASEISGERMTLSVRSAGTIVYLLGERVKLGHRPK